MIPDFVVVSFVSLVPVVSSISVVFLVFLVSFVSSISVVSLVPFVSLSSLLSPLSSPCYALPLSQAETPRLIANLKTFYYLCAIMYIYKR